MSNTSAANTPSKESGSAALIPSQRMRVAYLLTLVGGFLDAYTYMERGGVFANAQTGNIVKLGIALANGAQDKYLSYLIPICAFAAGLMCAMAIEAYLTERNLRLVRRTVLAAEMVGLAIVCLMPQGELWDRAANCIVSFVAAMQYETFTTFRGEAIVTTMSTGNLRKMVDALFLGVLHKDTEKIMRSLLFLSIIFTFALGAFFGTRACDALGKAAALPAIVILAVVIGIITLLRRRNATR